MSKNTKKKKWVRFRHKVVRVLACPILGTYSKIKYGFSVEKFKEKKKRQYLILFNHQTAFDQFFVGMAFKDPVYYVASEDIFSKGFVSSLLRYLVAPIPIKKQSTDVRAVLDCMRVAKEGGNIAIAPEGNRTFSGKTEYINKAIAPLARKLNLPILLYKIEGGYGVHPRWSDKVRRGRMHGHVSRVIEPDEYASITDDELFSIIKEGLFVNEGTLDKEFRGKRLAEGLERAFYYCPYCNLTEFHSEGNLVTCKKCSRSVEYLPTKELRGVGFDFPYRFTTEWYDAQSRYVNSIDTRVYTDEPVYAVNANLSEVIVYKRKEPIFENAKISLYGDRISVLADDGGTMLFQFSEISAVAVLGRNKVNIYHNKRIFQIKGEKSLNAIKFVHFYYRHKNISEGNNDAEFLGL